MPDVKINRKRWVRAHTLILEIWTGDGLWFLRQSHFWPNLQLHSMQSDVQSGLYRGSSELIFPSMCPPFHKGLKEASGVCRKLFFVTSSRSYLLSHSPLEVFNLYNIFESHKGAKKGKEKKCWYSGGTLKVVVGDHERTHKSREAINVMCVRLEGVKKEGKEASYISRAQAIISQHTHAAQVYCIVWKCVAWSQYYTE